MSLDQYANRLRYGSPQLRADAAHDLGQTHDVAAIPLLVQALNDKEYEVRAAAAAALAEYRTEARPALDRLLDLLRDKAWPVRKEAAVTVGLISDEKGVKPLVRLIEDGLYSPRGETQHRTVLEALIALGRIKNLRATDIMVKVLRKGYRDSAPTDWQIQLRQAAAYGLGFLDQPAGNEAMLALMREDERPEVRQAIITALSMLKSEQSFKILLDALPFRAFEDTTMVWRRQEAAIIALGERGDRRAVPYILPHTNSEYPEVRSALVRTLLQLGETQNPEALMELLRDRMPEVRAAAASALGHLQITAAAGALEVVSLDPDQRVAVAASTALESIKQLTAGASDNRYLPPASDSDKTE